MRRNLILAIAIASAGLLLTALPALAQTYSDSASGNETSANSTQGTFSGNATGSLPGSWSATVVHDPLPYCAATPCKTAAITGGTFTLNASSGTVSGQFSGGTVQQTGGFVNCQNQTYSVNGSLGKVGYGGGTGTGTFTATLTHYRFSFFGFCITYGATVKPPTSDPNIVLIF